MTAIGGGGTQSFPSASIEEELDELRQELCICEAELGLWNHRLAVARKHGTNEAANNRKRPRPSTTTESVAVVDPSQEMDMDIASEESVVKRPRPIEVSSAVPVHPKESHSDTGVASSDVPSVVDIPLPMPLTSPTNDSTPPTSLATPTTNLPTPTPQASPTNRSTLPPPLAAPTSHEPTPAGPLASPMNNNSTPPTPLASPSSAVTTNPMSNERQKLLQKLREERAKAARREKLLELQKTADETLKKQQRARARLELAELKDQQLPPNRPLPPSKPLSHRKQFPPRPNTLALQRERTLKRPRRHDAPPPTATATTRPLLEPHMYTLPKDSTLVLATMADLVSHLFRVCTRWLVQTNHPIALHALETQFQQYAGIDVSAAVAQVASYDQDQAPPITDLARVLSAFPLFDACVSGLLTVRSTDITSPLSSSPLSLSWLLPPEVSTAEHLATHLSYIRERFSAAVAVASRLESTSSAMDVVHAQAFLADVEVVALLRGGIIRPARTSDISLSVADLYMASLSSGVSGTPAATPAATTITTTTCSRRVQPYSIDDASPLDQIRAYRFHPAYTATHSVQPSLLSATYSNHVDPMKVLCPFELNGVCHDDKCEYQHERQYLISPDAAYGELMHRWFPHQDPTSATDADDAERLANLAVTTFQNAAGASSTDLLFIKEKTSKPPRTLRSITADAQPSLNEDQMLPTNIQASFCSIVNPLAKLRATTDVGFGLQFLVEDEGIRRGPLKSPARLSTGKPMNDVAAPPSELVEGEDFLVLQPASTLDATTDKLSTFDRYYSKDCTQTHVQELELQVAQHPDDVNAWMALALLHVDVDLPNIDDVGSWSCQSQVFQIIQVMRSKRHARETLNVDKAVHILARALEIEANLYSEVLWRLYLALYAKDGWSDLADQAMQFLPSSAKLWLCRLDHHSFGSVSAAAGLFRLAIEKITQHNHHPPTATMAHDVFELVVRWCRLYVDAGQGAQSRQLLESILDDKTSGFTAGFDQDQLATLWLVYMDLMVLGTVAEDVHEEVDVYDFVYSVTLVRDVVNQHPLPNVVAFESVIHRMTRSLGQNHVAVAIVRLNQVVVQATATKTATDNVAPLLSTLEDHMHGASPPRLCFSIATTLLSIDLPCCETAAQRWIQHLRALQADDDAQMYASMLDMTHAHLVLDAQTVVTKLLQWTEALNSNESTVGVAYGVRLLHAMGRLEGPAVASQHLDWVLERPSVSSRLTTGDQHHLWALRLHWAIQLGRDGDKVLRRFLQRQDDVPRHRWPSVAPAVEWCLQPPSRRFAFRMFRRYVSSFPEPLHARVFARFTTEFAVYPPFFVAYASTYTSSTSSSTR
ncbi:hypothetical protein, variant [Aphanomyces astaci]|uniref:C3H1-type domain-containing protein n=1 Tax=Aphanomyces astaci TaxID=112090 RepID=W4GK90_APHAT|nr:hypothetical protein, variant [Aphanomyces astaci]ETV80100.1 hypothetical protein, variant [Aphanomyces astaci]|eukprot:XP_009830024.1 hypothetical protein, variant [Aphanomyces astaci]